MHSYASHLLVVTMMALLNLVMLCSRCHWEGSRKVSCCGCAMYMPPYHTGIVCVGSMVHRLEGGALIFNAGQCALDFVLTVKVSITYVLGT